MARKYTLQSSHRPASGIDYASSLNPEQFRAVSSPPGHSLVIAGAGSGKTRTLTYRVAWLLDHGVQARQILLLTFTNKAAAEMTGRVRELIDSDTSALWAGTFHSIGSRILRRHAEEIGYTRSFSILDRDDQKSMISALIKQADIDTSQRRFPKPDVLVSVFSIAENTRMPICRTLDTSHPALYDWLPEIESLQQAYIQKKQASNAMDFDDLLVRTVELFEQNPPLLLLYRERFRHVLVDEYQDTNQVQGEFIDLLTGDDNSLMAVGDDAQSIYSWRGADLSLILEFSKRYHDAKVFTIETNYRSVPEILELSNASIRTNVARYEKNLSSARETLGVKPALIALETPSVQAEFVAQRIQELAETGVPLREMAVLYRAHFQSLEIQLELTSRCIPFAITSGLRFFEQAHIKDVVSIIRWVVNRRDEVSFLRMVSLLPGCGAVGAGKLWSQWVASGWATQEDPPPVWSDVLKSFRIPKKSAKHWDQLSLTVDELAPNGAFAPPAEMIKSILLGVYEEYLDASFDNSESRQADLLKLSEFAAKFEDVNEFLNQLSLLGTTDVPPAIRREEEKKQDVVTLSSIHQAKGLEWNAVFLIWLVQGQFPNKRILESASPNELEEERRLFYVALTRAKDELYLSYPMSNPKSYTEDYYCRPSMFLEEFPRELVEEWDVNGDDSPF